MTLTDLVIEKMMEKRANMQKEAGAFSPQAIAQHLEKTTPLAKSLFNKIIKPSNSSKIGVDTKMIRALLTQRMKEAEDTAIRAAASSRSPYVSFKASKRLKQLSDIAKSTARKLKSRASDAENYLPSVGGHGETKYFDTIEDASKALINRSQYLKK